MNHVSISHLYRNVLDEEAIIYKVTPQQIRTAFQNMRDVYTPDHFDLNSSVLQILNFNDAAHRCAYMHRYAPLHTAMALDMFRLAVEENYEVFWRIISKNTIFRICSLGSGPGCDVVGCIAAMHESFGTFSISSTFVDIQDGWEKTLNSVFKELERGDYALFSESVRAKHITKTFFEYNLLQTKWTNNSVLQAVNMANLITMVKFISSAVSKDTAVMIKKIFRACKPGCVILYIDNAVEKYHQLLTSAAKECHLRTIFGPVCHKLYERTEFDHSYYGNRSSCRTKVTIHMWEKVAPVPQSVGVVYSNNRESGAVSRPPGRRDARDRPNNVTMRRNSSEADASRRNEHTPMQNDDCCCKLM